MSRWFRFYAKTMRDPKVLKLTDKDYRLWMNLLCIASENDGSLPCDGDLKLLLGMRLDHLKGGLNRLIRGGLIDALDGGYEPHNWNKFQYKSDTSNERVKRFREKCNVTVTAPDTEAETDTEKKNNNYAFSGRVISLTESDLTRWQKSYSALDIKSLLQSRDDWLCDQPKAQQSKWFQSTSNWLANKNQVASALERRDGKPSMPVC